MPSPRNTPVSLPLAETLAAQVQTICLGRKIRAYQETTSTNDLAKEWAQAGAPEGSLVLAERQTAGRGRRGRKWQSRAGQNLLLSIVLRPQLPPERLPLVTLAAGLASADAMAPFVSPLAPSIKWPNDVLLGKRKCCGILVESVFETPSRPPTVALGIGINVNQDAFPAPLSSKATSLLLETGRHVPRAALLARLLEQIERRYRVLQNEEASIRADYEERLDDLGKPLALHLNDTDAPVCGTLHGIGPTGALLLKTDTGMRSFFAGEVTTYPPER